jgi:hypothetical protein
VSGIELVATVLAAAPVPSWREGRPCLEATVWAPDQESSLRALRRLAGHTVGLVDLGAPARTETRQGELS